VFSHDHTIMTAVLKLIGLTGIIVANWYSYQSIKRCAVALKSENSEPIPHVTLYTSPDTKFYYKVGQKKYAIRTVHRHELSVPSGTEIKFLNCKIPYYILDKKYDSNNMPKPCVLEFTSVLQKGIRIKHDSGLITQLVEDLDVTVDRHGKIFVSEDAILQENWLDSRIDPKNCFHPTQQIEATIVWPNVAKSIFIQMNQFINHAY